MCDVTVFVKSSPSHPLFSLRVITMLEAKLAEAGTLKELLDGKNFQLNTRISPILTRLFFYTYPVIKELVTDAISNITSNVSQAMDNSHVALIAIKLLTNGFKRYRCNRPMPLGVNLTSLTKVLKCAKDDDVKTCG